MSGRLMPTDEAIRRTATAARIAIERYERDAPYLIEQARRYRRGFRAATLGDGGGSGGTSITENLALGGRDIAAEIEEWMTLMDEAIGALVNADSRRGKLMPADGPTERENTVEICADCGEPAPKVKRVNGLPYHATSCYYRVWRSGRDGVDATDSDDRQEAL
jgi:hypothetical protein